MVNIPFHKPHLVGTELHYLAQAVQSDCRLDGGGPYTRRCRDWLAARLGCAAVFLTPSGTAALEMASLLAGIGPGDEVIMPSFTYVATATPFVRCGATPVFVDIRPDTLNLDESRLEAALTSRTQAIVPVHYGGGPCALEEIGRLAAVRGLTVIEDAAHAFLSRYRERFLGTWGALGCLSFHATKNISAGEGGALLVNDPALLPRAEILWDKGTDRARQLRGEIEQYTWVDLGASFAPGELAGAFLLAQLEHAEAITRRRRHLFHLYHQALSPLQEQGWLRLLAWGPDSDPNGHLFPLLTRSPEERTRLRDHLARRSIATALHYLPLHSSPAGRRYGRTPGPLPVTEAVAATLLRLPLYPDLTEAEAKYIVESIMSFYDNSDRGAAV